MVEAIYSASGKLSSLNFVLTIISIVLSVIAVFLICRAVQSALPVRCKSAGNVTQGIINVKLDEEAFPPERAHDLDAGLDLKTPFDFVMKSYGSQIIDTGVHVAIPAGYAGVLMSKSGLNVKNGITNTGLIDSGYTGSIRVKLYNNTSNQIGFSRGDKVSQLMIVPVALPNIKYVDSLEPTERGDGGFGSTGR